MVIELVAGPLDGVLHEVAGGWPVPSRMALPSDGQLHWYDVDEETGTATYIKSEPIKAE